MRQVNVRSRNPHGLRWQSGASTPLSNRPRPPRRRRRSALPAQSMRTSIIGSPHLDSFIFFARNGGPPPLWKIRQDGEKAPEGRRTPGCWRADRCSPDFAAITRFWSSHEFPREFKLRTFCALCAFSRPETFGKEERDSMCNQARTSLPRLLLNVAV